MVYQASGAGRDSFIFLGPQERYGTYGKVIKEVHQQETQMRINEFWNKHETIEQAPLDDSRFKLSKDSRIKVHGSPSEIQDRQYFATKSSVGASTTSKDVNSSSGQIHCETRIPHYHGHIPGLHNVVGFSPHSSNSWVTRKF